MVYKTMGTAYNEIAEKVPTAHISDVFKLKDRQYTMTMI